jgi:hypothetical protein
MLACPKRIGSQVDYWSDGIPSYGINEFGDKGHSQNAEVRGVAVSAHGSPLPAVREEKTRSIIPTGGGRRRLAPTAVRRRSLESWTSGGRLRVTGRS